MDKVCTNLFQDPTEMQLQQQSDQLAKLQQQNKEQNEELEVKLQQIKQLSEVMVSLRHWGGSTCFRFLLNIKVVFKSAQF